MKHFSLLHCVKRVCIRNFSGPYFPVFGLNMDRNNSEYRHFSRSVDDLLKSEYSQKKSTNPCNRYTFVASYVGILTNNNFSIMMQM